MHEEFGEYVKKMLLPISPLLAWQSTDNMLELRYEDAAHPQP